jgi:hypothetical protein
MAADVSTSPELRAGVPHELFRLPRDSHSVASTHGGDRFLLALPGEPQTPPHLTVLVNWQNATER